jgi:hypothetical protein
MPRTGNIAFADFITAQDPPSSPNPNPKQRNYRVVRTGDYIPDSLNLTVTVNETLFGGIVGWHCR